MRSGNREPRRGPLPGITRQDRAKRKTKTRNLCATARRTPRRKSGMLWLLDLTCDVSGILIARSAKGLLRFNLRSVELTSRRSRRALRPSFSCMFRPLGTEGARECRVPSAPAASCAYGSGRCTRVFTAVAPEITRHPRTQWFYGLYRALPGDRAFLPPSPAEVAFHKLDASVEASGPHDFAVRFSAVRYRHIRVHRIPPRVRDDREPPLRWDGTAEISEVIWVGREAKIFLKMGLDSKSLICPTRRRAPLRSRAAFIVTGRHAPRKWASSTQRPIDSVGDVLEYRIAGSSRRLKAERLAREDCRGPGPAVPDQVVVRQ
jgi:hypothetical protein